jgi:hypothetical protein
MLSIFVLAFHPSLSFPLIIILPEVLGGGFCCGGGNSSSSIRHASLLISLYNLCSLDAVVSSPSPPTPFPSRQDYGVDFPSYLTSLYMLASEG